MFSSFVVCFFLSFLLRVCCSQTCLSNNNAVTHSAIGNDIEWTDLGLSTYHITLQLSVCYFDNSDDIASFITRCYNNSIPGPTIRMKRANIYNITLINALGPENEQDSNIPINQFRHPNHTNVHTHGLHVSGSFPGDYVFKEIAPGESFTYSYYIPCNHAGGTFFYHPHVHGSTALQVGGGALGMLIVEDDEEMEGLPTWLVNMNEILLSIYYIDLPTVETYSTTDDLFSYDNSTGELTDFHLVNGFYQPTICLNASEWTRFRISYAAVEAPMSFHLDECTLYLISLDGILIHGTDNSVPRLVDYMWFTQGSRADLAVYCPGDASGTKTYNLLDSSNNIIAFIKVTGIDTTPTYPQETLTVFHPIRPSYLVDLTRYTGPFHEFCDNSACKDNTTIVIRPRSLDGIPFRSETNYLFNITVGEFVEFIIDGNTGRQAHPFHMHINPVQLISGGHGDLPNIPNNWSQFGDFLDVVLGNSVIRWYADTYGGTVNVHCHLLRHEDEGSMGTFYLNGGCNAKDEASDSSDTCVVPTCDTIVESNNPSISPTINPTQNSVVSVTNNPSQNPTINPTPIPSNTPNLNPSLHPSLNPSTTPTVNPTFNPTNNPTNIPTVSPNANPTRAPTNTPSNNPTLTPTLVPIVNPSTNPTIEPSNIPTNSPTLHQTTIATNNPTNVPTIPPTNNPTTIPSTHPSTNPSNSPSNNPSIQPTITPTTKATQNPTVPPTSNPTIIPTTHPSTNPSISPSNNPSTEPTKNGPTIRPTFNPSANPHRSPSNTPSNHPTFNPTKHPSISPTLTTAYEFTTQFALNNFPLDSYIDFLTIGYLDLEAESDNIISSKHENWNGYSLIYEIDDIDISNISVSLNTSNSSRRLLQPQTQTIQLQFNMSINCIRLSICKSILSDIEKDEISFDSFETILENNYNFSITVSILFISSIIKSSTGEIVKNNNNNNETTNIIIITIVSIVGCFCITAIIIYYWIYIKPKLNKVSDKKDIETFTPKTPVLRANEKETNKTDNIFIKQNELEYSNDDNDTLLSEKSPLVNRRATEILENEWNKKSQSNVNN